jgi:hypothetical protein
MRCVQRDHKGTCKREARGSQADRQQDEEAEGKEHSDRRDAGRSHEPRNAGGLEKLGREAYGFFPRTSKRTSALLTTFELLTSRSVTIINKAVSCHPICGNLLYQQKERNTAKAWR